MLHNCWKWTSNDECCLSGIIVTSLGTSRTDTLLPIWNRAWLASLATVGNWQFAGKWTDTWVERGKEAWQVSKDFSELTVWWIEKAERFHYFTGSSLWVLYVPFLKLHKVQSNSIIQYKTRQNITVQFLEGLGLLAIAVMPCHRNSYCITTWD